MGTLLVVPAGTLAYLAVLAVALLVRRTFLRECLLALGGVLAAGVWLAFQRTVV